MNKTQSFINSSDAIVGYEMKNKYLFSSIRIWMDDIGYIVSRTIILLCRRRFTTEWIILIV